MSGSDSTSPDSGQSYHYRNILFEKQLKVENQKLREKLHKAELQLEMKDNKIRELTETKNAVKKLYSVSRGVLRAITDNNAHDDRRSYPNYRVNVNAKVIDELCDDLQEKLSDWQEKHQLLHDQLEEAMRVMNELADMLPPPSPSPLVPDPPSQPQPEPAQFACEHCGAFIYRMEHVCAKLELLRSLGLVPTSEAGRPRASSSNSKEWDRQLPKNVQEGNAPPQHEYPTTPLTRIPNNFAKRPNKNHAKCGFCKKDYNRKLGMKAHLRITHGVEYRRGRFACLGCGEEFAKNREIVAHRHK